MIIRRCIQLLSVLLPLTMAGANASAGLLGTQVQGCSGLLCSLDTALLNGFVPSNASVIDPGIEFVDPGIEYELNSVRFVIPGSTADFTNDSLTIKNFSGSLGNNFYRFALPNVTIANVTFVSGTFALGLIPANPCDFPFFETGFVICAQSSPEGVFMTFNAHEIWVEIDNWGSLQVPDNTIVETFQVITAEISEPPTFLLAATGLFFCVLAAAQRRISAAG